MIPENVKTMQEILREIQQLDEDIKTYRMRKKQLENYFNLHGKIQISSMNATMRYVNASGIQMDTYDSVGVIMRMALSEYISDDLEKFMKYCEVFADRKRKILDRKLKKIMVDGLGLNLNDE